MSFTLELPVQKNGAWALKDAVIEIHHLQLGRTHEYRCFISWSDNMTLVLAGKFSSKKDIEAFVAETKAEGLINVYSAAEYRDLEKPPTYAWIKQHPTPHEKAPASDFPWGNPINFPNESS